MLKEEAVWIKGILDEFVVSPGLDVLDVGSSTLKFRTLIQPYIDECVFAPLRAKNSNIFYLDKKQDEGVDYVFDINVMDADCLDKKFDLVFCCNLLEHVSDRNKIYGLLVEFLKNKGYLVLTVPEVYRFHPDPIDTMFRPRMVELINLFSKFGDFEIIKNKVVVINEKKRYSMGICEKIRYKLPFLRWRINCLLLRKK